MANMELIEAKTVGSGGAANIDFTSIPSTYTDLKIVLSARSNNSAIYEFVGLKFNGATTNYSNLRLRGNGSSVSSASGSYSTIEIEMVNGDTSTSNTFGSMDIYIPNYAGSNYKSISAEGVNETNATTAYIGLVAGLWSNTAAINQITLVPNVGTAWLQYTTAYLYGIQNVTAAAKATGGTVTSDGAYFYHTFLSSGTFTPTTAISADVLCIAGGGGGGSRSASGGEGGGGAGGLLYFASQSLGVANYTCTVGGGGSAVSSSRGNSGTDSQFGSLTLVIGGGGGANRATVTGKDGGSGGGGTYFSGAGGTATSGQGNNGGPGSSVGGDGGGGGGAGAVGGTPLTGSPYTSGVGGAGINTYSGFASATSTGVSGYYAGGGGGGGLDGGGTGGSGGGGAGGGNGASAGTNGTTNTGGGGGGGNGGGNGGSGLVIIRYAI
jgi:hypothetical protein